ncbi:hypothetical protein D3C80_1031280 [compost metagenome]
MANNEITFKCLHSFKNSASILPLPAISNPSTFLQFSINSSWVNSLFSSHWETSIPASRKSCSPASGIILVMNIFILFGFRVLGNGFKVFGRRRHGFYFDNLCVDTNYRQQFINQKIPTTRFAKLKIELHQNLNSILALE